MPLLAGVLGCLDVCVRAMPVLRNSWLGSGVWSCVLGLGFRLRPAAPGWGFRVSVCLCARSNCIPPFLAGLCGVGVCCWAQVPAAHHLFWLGCWGLCVFVCALRLYPATPGWAVRCGSVCVGSGFGCTPPTLAGVLGCVSVFGAHSACTPPLLAGVCGVGVCAWARVSAAPPHSWPGSWGVCVCVCACSVCTPPLLAGVCGVGLCAWACFLAAPRPSWLGCWGVCVCVRALLVARHSWLGCAVSVCDLGPGFWLRPATPSWCFGVFVCLCARSACTPPLLAGLCGVGVCAWARVSAAPRHWWMGLRGVCVSLCALRLYHATPGWGVQCGCVCFNLGFSCAPPLLAGFFRCVCIFCARSACTPPLLAGVCAVVVCAWARISAAARQFWLGCWGVCVFVCALRSYPPTPGWKCGVGVCAWA